MPENIPENINDIFLLYVTHTSNVQRRMQTMLDVTIAQENIMTELMNIILNNQRQATTTNNVSDDIQTLQNIINRQARRQSTRQSTMPTTPTTQQPIGRESNNTQTFNPFSFNRFNHPRTESLFTFPRMNGNIQNRWNGMINRMNAQDNNDFLTPVIVRPTQSQINRATRMVNYSSIVNPSNTRCPISLVSFEEEDEVMQIRECGHLFIRDELMNWFEQNVRCPLCRYDIRTYIPSRNNSTSDLFNGINLENIPSFSSDSSNSAPITPRNNTPQPIPNNTQSLLNTNTNANANANANLLLDENFVRNTINNDPEIQQMINNIQNTLFSTVSNMNSGIDTTVRTEVGYIDSNGRYNIFSNNSLIPSANNNSPTTNNNSPTTNNNIPTNQTYQIPTLQPRPTTRNPSRPTSLVQQDVTHVTRLVESNNNENIDENNNENIDENNNENNN